MAAKFFKCLLPHISGDLPGGTITDGNAKVHGQREQFLLVPYLITAHLAFADGQ